MKKARNKKIKAIFLFGGYVETNSINMVPMYHYTGFDSIEEALEDIGKSILKFHSDDRYVYTPCCKKWKNKQPTYNNCPTCGRQLHKALYMDDALDIFDTFLRGTIDSTGEYWEDLEKAGWIFGSGVMQKVIKEDFVVEISSCAEDLLWHASQGTIAQRREHDMPYRAVLKDHINIWCHKPSSKPCVKIYKD